VIRVARIGEDAEKLGIAPRTAAVLGRAGTAAGEALKDVRRGFVNDDLLEHDVVAPVIAEVIVIPKPILGATEKG
jgi:hypothetical protein